MTSVSFYLTFTPSESNPLTSCLETLKRTRPNGAVPPNVYALVPLIIKFSPIRGKKPTEDEIGSMKRRIELTVGKLIPLAIDKLSGEIHQAEKWTDVVTDASFRTHAPGTAFMKIEYGEVSRGLIEILSSELIRETMGWSTKYGFQVDVTRTDMDIMLLASCPGEMVLNRFMQKVYDQKIQISARQWLLGLSVDKKYLWKRSWWEVIQQIVL